MYAPLTQHSKHTARRQLRLCARAQRALCGLWRAILDRHQIGASFCVRRIVQRVGDSRCGARRGDVGTWTAAEQVDRVGRRAQEGRGQGRRLRGECAAIRTQTDRRLGSRQMIERTQMRRYNTARDTRVQQYTRVSTPPACQRCRGGRQDRLAGSTRNFDEATSSTNTHSIDFLTPSQY